MYPKILKFIIALVVVGFTAGQAMAVSTISLTQPNPISTNGSPTLDLNVVGAFDVAVDAGDMTFMWDPTVLEYTGTTIANPPWDTFAVSDGNAATGVVDFVFLGTSGPALTNFDILTISFNVTGALGTSSILDMENSFTGWSAPGGINVPVVYNDGQVTVSSVPVPAAVWLFGSGLLGLVGVARRRSAHAV